VIPRTKADAEEEEQEEEEEEEEEEEGLKEPKKTTRRTPFRSPCTVALDQQTRAPDEHEYQYLQNDRETVKKSGLSLKKLFMEGNLGKSTIRSPLTRLK